MYYNKNTQREQSRRPVPLHVDGVAYTRPTEQQYKAEGWLPLERFRVPEGYEIIQGTKQIEWDSDKAWEVYQIESQADAALRRLKERASRLTPVQVDAYADFHPVYAQAVYDAIEAGAQIDPEDISYQALNAALMQLPGEQWIRTAMILQNLWRVIVFNFRGSDSDALAALPALEYRRLNPPTEPEFEGLE